MKMAEKRNKWLRPGQAKTGLSQKLVSLVIMIGLWWGLSFLLPANIMPNPLTTVETLILDWREGLVIYHLFKTFTRVGLGFAISMVLGIIIGCIMGLSRPAELMLDLWVLTLLSIPGLAIVVVTFIAIGLNEIAAVTAVVLAGTPVIIINMWEGVKNIDISLVDMAKSYDATFRKRFTDVLVPQILPYIVASGRMALGLIWKVVVVVELLGCSNGVGFQLYYWFQLYDMAQVLAWTMLSVIIILTIELVIFKPLETRLFKWRPSARL